MAVTIHFVPMPFLSSLTENGEKSSPGPSPKPYIALRREGGPAKKKGGTGGTEFFMDRSILSMLSVSRSLGHRGWGLYLISQKPVPCGDYPSLLHTIRAQSLSLLLLLLYVQFHTLHHTQYNIAHFACPFDFSLVYHAPSVPSLKGKCLLFFKQRVCPSPTLIVVQTPFQSGPGSC